MAARKRANSEDDEYTPDRQPRDFQHPPRKRVSRRELKGLDEFNEDPEPIPHNGIYKAEAGGYYASQTWEPKQWKNNYHYRGDDKWEKKRNVLHYYGDDTPDVMRIGRRSTRKTYDIPTEDIEEDPLPLTFAEARQKHLENRATGGRRSGIAAQFKSESLGLARAPQLREVIDSEEDNSPNASIEERRQGIRGLLQEYGENGGHANLSTTIFHTVTEDQPGLPSITLPFVHTRDTIVLNGPRYYDEEQLPFYAERKDPEAASGRIVRAVYLQGETKLWFTCDPKGYGVCSRDEDGLTRMVRMAEEEKQVEMDYEKQLNAQEEDETREENEDDEDMEA